MANAEPASAPKQPTVGVYAHHQEAHAAIEALKAAGIRPRAISVLARSPREAHALHQETGAAEDLEGDVGHHPLRAVLDLAGRVESVLVPGFGGVLVTGDLMSSIRADLGDLRHRGRRAEAAGVITGALVGLGLPVDEAARLEAAVSHGQILVVVHGRYDAAAASAALQAGQSGA